MGSSETDTDLTPERARDLLRDSRPALDAAFATDFSVLDRPGDPRVSIETVTSDRVARHGQTLAISYGFPTTPLGRCLLATTERKVCALWLLEKGHEAVLAQGLAQLWRDAPLLEDEAVARDIARRLFELPAPEKAPVPLLLRGTRFQVEVWKALLRIPRGCVISYGDLARRIGVPTSTRAVANAVGANPVALAIPCHRVIRSTGDIGGYRWGASRKKALLARELAAEAAFRG